MSVGSIVTGVVLAAVPAVMAFSWVGSAGKRLAAEDSGTAEAEPAAAIASAADEGYCDGDLRKVLRRVLQSCGLMQTGEVRGCQPVQAKSVATMTGTDFNALFMPLSQRAGIIQFEQDSADLDPEDAKLLGDLFADQRGASYFFVVARSSPEGSVEHNRELSHLRQSFNDPDLDREVGLLWLGEEFAQLEQDFCGWKRSGAADKCKPKDINRSAFVAWIDCRL